MTNTVKRVRDTLHFHKLLKNLLFYADSLQCIGSIFDVDRRVAYDLLIFVLALDTEANYRREELNRAVTDILPIFYKPF
jgi:hypothetical protein